MLLSVKLEYLRPFSTKALDFLQFLRFDLGLSAYILINTFQLQYLEKIVQKAHQADFKRRDISLDYRYNITLQMKISVIIKREVYYKKYRLYNICPSTI